MPSEALPGMLVLYNVCAWQSLVLFHVVVSRQSPSLACYVPFANAISPFGLQSSLSSYSRQHSFSTLPALDATCSSSCDSCCCYSVVKLAQFWSGCRQACSLEEPEVLQPF
jgi:hypothetical protein